MPTKYLLQQSFPELGLVRVPLYAESADLYAFLETTRNSGIRRLDSIEQLGELKHVIHCGHHSRYEYLVMQLHLVHLVKKYSKAGGLSTSVDLKDGVVFSSGEELLKCWALLLENGHLKGTYEIERFWLRQIVTDDRLKGFFLDLIGDPEIKNYAVGILDNQNLHRFYRLLAWINLKRESGKTSLSESRRRTVDQSTSALKALFLDAEYGSTLWRCRSYFEKLRKLAVLYLDLARLPVHIKFHPSLILQDLQENPELYLEKNRTSSRWLFDSLHGVLLERVYASIDATRYKLVRLRELERTYDIQKKKPENVFCITSPQKLGAALQDAKAGTPMPFRGDLERTNHVLRLHFQPLSLGGIKIHGYSEEKDFHAKVGKGLTLFTTTYPSTYAPGVLLDLFRDGTKPDDGLPKAVNWLLHRIRRWVGTSYISTASLNVIHYAEDDFVSEILMACLKRIIRPGIAPRFGHSVHYRTDSIALLHKDERLNWSKSIAWQNKRERPSDSTRWESECLRREVRSSSRGAILASNRAILLEDASAKQVGEIDGFFIRIYRDNMEFGFIEAKSVNSGGAAEAVTQLKTTLTKMGCPTSIVEKLVRRAEKSALALVPFTVARDWAKADPWPPPVPTS